MQLSWMGFEEGQDNIQNKKIQEAQEQYERQFQQSNSKALHGGPLLQRCEWKPQEDLWQTWCAGLL